jgi:ankyrin repeat protein
MKKLVYILLLLLLSFLSFSQTKNVFDIARNGTLNEIKQIYNENKSAIDSTNDKSFSPLILACYKNNEEVALFLIEKTADINYRSNIGNALMAAVMKGNLKVINSLLEKKVDLNSQDQEGNSALYFATLTNQNEIVKLLLKAGAKIDLKNNADEIPLDIAKRNKNTELIILLNI